MNPNSVISLRTAVGTLLVFAPLLAAKEAYEKPRKLATAEVLQEAVRAGDHFRVKSPVENDGFMNLYAVDSDYGQFEAYGNFALGKLLHEIHAIAELDEVSKSKEFLETAARSATGQLKTIGEFAQHPTATVKGMPKGVKRMFHQYEGQAKKGYQAAKDVGGDVGDAIVPGDADDDKGEEGGGDVAEATGKATQAAESYAKKWFGTTAAERRWYKKLEVDPYTRNPVLRNAVSNMAKVDAAAHVGMKFVPIPSIPGVSYLNRMNHAVWDADPEELRKLNIQRLRDAGVDQKQIDRFMNNEHLSPTQQTLLLSSLADMKGVQGTKKERRFG